MPFLPLLLPTLRPSSSSYSLSSLKKFGFLSMADNTHFDSPKTQLENDLKSVINYPVPLSPPMPLISKDIELSRAMTASSKSSLFSLSRTHVLFEDDWLIAVSKPQGVYCEAILSSVPSLLNHSLDSVQLDTQMKQPEFHLANRLDRDTSGVMLITKSHKVAAKLVKAFTDHKVKKTYIAFCTGTAPNWRRINIESGHGRSKFGAWRVYARSDVGRKLPGGSVVRDMATLFEVLSVNGQCCTKDSSELENDEKKVMVVEEKSVIDCGERKDEIVVRAYPRSGRTHQIRLHCQYLGISIRGDVKYEGVHEWKGKNYDYHELHAESLTFDHPVTGVPIVILAPLPVRASETLHQSGRDSKHSPELNFTLDTLLQEECHYRNYSCPTRCNCTRMQALKRQVIATSTGTNLVAESNTNL